MKPTGMVSFYLGRNTVPWIVLLSMLSNTGARAAEPGILEQCQYLQHSHRYLEAAELAARALDEDPTHPGAHFAYQSSWSLLGEQSVIVHQYRSWYEASPANEVARVSLARVLLTDDRVGNREEVEHLLGMPFVDDRARFWALRTLYVSRSLANPPGDFDTVLEQMAELSHRDEGRASSVAILRAFHEPIEGALARDLERSARVCPWHVGRIAVALWNDEATGAALDRVRSRVVQRATVAARSDDPLEVAAASVAFQRAGEQELEDRADQRLAELDPAWRELWHPLGRRVAAAVDREDPEGSLEFIDQIEEEASTDWEFSAIWSARARLLSSMGRTDVALHAWMMAHEHNPDEVAIILRYVALAALQDTHQALALELLDHALDLGHAEDYGTEARGRTDGYDRWRERHNQHLGNLYYFKARLLSDMGDTEGAAAACRMSLTLDDDFLAHALMGRLYEQLDQPDLAFEHRVRGLPPGSERAWQSLQTAWEQRPYWHPAGAQGYFDDRADAHEESDVDDPPGPQEVPEGGAEHALLDRTLPDLVFDVDGRQMRLSEFEGPVLLELWATW